MHLFKGIEKKQEFFFFWLEFTLYKAEQSLQGVELKGNIEDQDENNTRKLIKKNPKITGTC